MLLLDGLGKSKIFKNFSWIAGDKLIRMVINLVVSVLVARYLGAEQYGYWSYLLSFVLFFTVFSSLGLDSITPRELIKRTEEESSIISTVFRLKLFGGMLGFALCLITYMQYKRLGFDSLLPLSLVASLLIFQSLEVFDYVFKSKLEARFTIYARNASFVVLTIFKLTLIYQEAPLIYFLPINALELLIGGALVFYFFKNRHATISLFDWDSGLAKSLLKDSLPMALSGLLTLIYMRVDQIMVTDMVGEVANGIYATGVRMIEALYFIPMALGESFYPGLVYSREQSKERYAKNLLSFYSIMTYIGLVLTTGVVVVALPLMAWLYGANFTGSGMVLLIYGFTIYNTFIGIAVGRFLAAENYLRIIFYQSVFGMLVNIALNYYLINRYGYIGAAYASLISYYLVTLSLLCFAPGRAQLKLIIMAIDPRLVIAKIREKTDS